MKRTFICCALSVVLSSISLQAQETEAPATNPKAQATQASNEASAEPAEDESDAPAALNFKMKNISGEEVDLSGYAGNVVVIVNTASKCGMTPQYEGLQKLHEGYGEKGVKVLGFPCNQFGGQEPGTEEDIQAFCQKNYGVEFDMFSKVEVNGDGACDLYKYLTAQSTKPKKKGNITWNFEKFVIDKSGNLVGRFGSRVKPDNEEFMAVIKTALEAETEGEVASDGKSNDK